MQSFIAIHTLGEKLWPENAMSGTLFYDHMFFCLKSLLYEVSGGNQVDGLPPAASTGEDSIGPAPVPYKCMISTSLIVMCSRSFYSFELLRSQKLRMIISFHFI